MADLLGVDLKSGRIWLHMINLCVGMSIFVAAYSFATSISATIYQQMAKFGTNLVLLSDKEVFYVPGKRGSLDWEAYQRLVEKLGKYYDITPVTQYRDLVSDGSRLHNYLTVWAVNPEFFSIVRLSFLNGRAFTTFEDQAGVIGCVFGPLMGYDSVELRIGESITVGDVPCRLEGIVSRENIAATFSTAWGVFISSANLPAAGSVLNHPVTQIFLRKKNGDLERTIGRQISEILHDGYDVSHLINWSASEYWEARVTVINRVGLLIIIIATVIVGLAAVSLGNGLLLDVALRRGEIGLRMALGATRTNIFFMIVMEGLAIVVCGGGAGIALGLGVLHLIIVPVAAQELLDGQRVSVTTGLTGIVVSLATLFVVAMAASIVPARRAALIEPSVALRDL